MSSKVKQANFRLPLEYMSMIDDFASRENITKAAVITRALDCMQASYDSCNDRARGRRKGRKGPYRKHGILRASTLFEGSPNLKEAFTYTRFHHLPRLPHFPYNTQAAPYPPSGAAFLRPQTVPTRQLLRAIVSLAGGCGRPSAEEKPAANLWQI